MTWGLARGFGKRLPLMVLGLHLGMPHTSSAQCVTPAPELVSWWTGDCAARDTAGAV